MFRSQLGDAGQRVEAQRRTEVVDGPEGGVERLDPLVVVDLPAEADHLPADVDLPAVGGFRRTVGEVADQVVGGGDADRQVRPVGQLAEHRGVAHRGVEAEAVHADVFGELAAGIDVAHHVGGHQAVGQGFGEVAGDRPQGVGQRRQVGPGIVADVGVQGRLLGVVVDEVEAELGAVQFLGDVAEGHAELAVVARVDVLADGRHLHHVAVGRGHAVGIEAGVLQRAAEQRIVAQRLVQADDVAEAGHRGVQRGAGEVAVAGVAAVGEQVGLGEEGTDRVEAGFLPVPLVEGFHRQVVGQADVEAQRFHRHQHFLELGTGQAVLGGVHRVGGVDPATVEDALAPVEHLAAEARAQRHVADVPAAVDVGVEDFRLVPGDIAGLAGETVVVGIALARLRWIVVAVVVVALVHDLGVIERRAADEHAIVAPGRLQVRGDLVDLGNQAGIEVAVAVVGVDVVVALVLPLHPPQGAVGQGGVERTGHLVVEEAEFDGLGLAAQQRQQPDEGEAGPGRRGAQPGLAVGDVHRELTPCGHALGAATAGGSPFGRFSAALLWVVAASPASHRRKGTARRGSATGMPIQRNPPGNSMDCEKNRTSCGMTVHSLTRKQEVSDKTRQANFAGGAKSPFAEPAQGGSRNTIKRTPSMENSEAIPRSNKGRYQPVASNTLFRAKLADQARLLLTTS